MFKQCTLHNSLLSYKRNKTVIPLYSSLTVCMCAYEWENPYSEVTACMKYFIPEQSKIEEDTKLLTMLS